METELIVPLLITAGVGGLLSHLIANRKLRRLKGYFARQHAEAMTSLADAAVEVMAVEYGADITDAQTKLAAAATKRSPGIVMIPVKANSPQARKANEKVAKLRAEKANKEPTNGDEKKD